MCMYVILYHSNYLTRRQKNKKNVGSISKLILSYAYTSFSQHLVCKGNKKELFSRISEKLQTSNLLNI